MTGLRLARSLVLPLEVAGEATGILAKRGAGKTNTGTVLVEEVVAKGVQVVVLDPVGVWYGLRAGADGGPSGGLDVYVLGGAHGDLPLEAHGGADVADAAVEYGQSFVLDLSDFSKTQQRRFVAEFAQKLYALKARSKSPLLLVMEEADEFAPQRVAANDAPMVGAISLIVKRGRSRGLGILFITQRSASLNKDVLDQADVLIVMRTVGPRDVAAIKGWIEYQQADGFDQVLPSLASLETGEAWVWNPERGLLRRVKVRARKTFDSSDTPKPGAPRAEPREVKPLDLDKLGEQMRATAERVKENDPAELRRRIASLQRELRERPTETETVEREIRIEVPVISDEALDRIERACALVERTSEVMTDAYGQLRDVLFPLASNVRDAVQARSIPPRKERASSDTHSSAGRSPQADRGPRQIRGASAGEARSENNGRLNRRAERMVLAVLAQYPEGRTKRQTAILAGYAVKGGGFNGALSKLRTLGFITGSEMLTITQKGLAAIEGQWEPLPTGGALLDYWLSTLNRAAERAVLTAVYDAYPDAISKEEIAEKTGYEVTGGGFNGALSKLRTLELIERGDPVRAAAAFFE